MSDVFENAEKFADSHEKQVDAGIEKAGQQIDDRTGNKYDKEVDKAEHLAEQHVGDGNPDSNRDDNQS